MSGLPGLRGRLVRPRRSDVLVAVLLLVLGFAAVVQVRAADSEPLDTARQEDLVAILDELSNRDDRLRAEVAALEQTRRELTSGGRTEAALDEARRRAQLLGVLAGTVEARGPGVLLTITDPDGRIGPEVLLDALEELRAAGAEAVQLEGPVDLSVDPSRAAVGEAVRVVASTALVEGEDGGVEVDGVALFAPYRFVVVGDPGTLSSALGIPGGVVDNVEQRGGAALVAESDELLVGALRRLPEPRYARPAPGSGD